MVGGSNHFYRGMQRSCTETPRGVCVQKEKVHLENYAKLSFPQGALKGTNLRRQTELKIRFSQIFADSRLFLETKQLGNADLRRKPTADFRSKLQKTAGTRRKPQRRLSLRFIPSSAALFLVLRPCPRARDGVAE